MKIVVATRNQGKLNEFRKLLGHLPIEIFSLEDYPDIPEIAETGTTFAANAAIKAETVAKIVGEWVVADDSGLEVDALGGRPGVYSARYAGEYSSDEDNNAKLLAELVDKPDSERTARFRAVIAVAHIGEPTLFAEGACEGKIAFAPRGTEGFGYDPLFIENESGKTFAELSATEKNRISHRARAVAEMLHILEEIERQNT